MDGDSSCFFHHKEDLRSGRESPSGLRRPFERLLCYSATQKGGGWVGGWGWLFKFLFRGYVDGCFSLNLPRRGTRKIRNEEEEEKQERELETHENRDLNLEACE